MRSRHEGRKTKGLRPKDTGAVVLRGLIGVPPRDTLRQRFATSSGARVCRFIQGKTEGVSIHTSESMFVIGQEKATKRIYDAGHSLSREQRASETDVPVRVGIRPKKPGREREALHAAAVHRRRADRDTPAVHGASVNARWSTKLADTQTYYRVYMPDLIRRHFFPEQKARRPEPARMAHPRALGNVIQSRLCGPGRSCQNCCDDTNAGEPARRHSKRLRYSDRHRERTIGTAKHACSPNILRLRSRRSTARATGYRSGYSASPIRNHYKHYASLPPNAFS